MARMTLNALRGFHAEKRELELSASVYDEIESLLLTSGHDFSFENGPGSAIDLSAFKIIRRKEDK